MWLRKSQGLPRVDLRVDSSEACLWQAAGSGHADYQSYKQAVKHSPSCVAQACDLVLLCVLVPRPAAAESPKEDAGRHQQRGPQQLCPEND